MPDIAAFTVIRIRIKYKSRHKYETAVTVFRCRYDDIISLSLLLKNKTRHSGLSSGENVILIVQIFFLLHIFKVCIDSTTIVGFLVKLVGAGSSSSITYAGFKEFNAGKVQ